MHNVIYLKTISRNKGPPPPPPPQLSELMETGEKGGDLGMRVLLCMFESGVSFTLYTTV